jgi:single-stranded DNA-binding protein
MRDINEATLLGTVNQPVRVNPTKNGSVANVSIETKQVRGDKSFSTYHNVTCWNDLADIAATLQEGDRVFATGRISTDSYEKGGQKVYKKILTASAFAKIAQGADSGETASAAPSAPQGGPPGSGFSGGKGGGSAFPYVDKLLKVSWNKPEPDGFSYSGKGGKEYCASWKDPTNPKKGGTVYWLTENDGWEERAHILEDSDIPF